MGRVSCILYDYHGKVKEFCIWDEEKGVERRFTTSHESLIELAIKAWDEKLLIEIIIVEGQKMARYASRKALFSEEAEI